MRYIFVYKWSSKTISPIKHIVFVTRPIDSIKIFKHFGNFWSFNHIYSVSSVCGLSVVEPIAFLSGKTVLWSIDQIKIDKTGLKWISDYIRTLLRTLDPADIFQFQFKLMQTPWDSNFDGFFNSFYNVLNSHMLTKTVPSWQSIQIGWPLELLQNNAVKVLSGLRFILYTLNSMVLFRVFLYNYHPLLYPFKAFSLQAKFDHIQTPLLSRTDSD